MDLGLVLEGGGMRGVFTAGVGDCFLDNNIYFPYTIGVSAGASNGLSYASRQRGRAIFCNVGALKLYNYIGFKFMLTQRCIMDYNYLFGKLPREIYPFDFETYLKSGRFILTATDCNTGKPAYFDTPQTNDDLLVKCRASCSLPYCSTIVKCDGSEYLDGGVSDPLPIRKAQADGYRKCVVVLTRNAGYRKKSLPFSLSWLFYRKYPNLRKAMQRRVDKYNDSLSYIEELEASGDIVVIRPKKPIVVGRLESNTKKLEDFYQEGYDCASEAISKIRELTEK